MGHAHDAAAQAAMSAIRAIGGHPFLFSQSGRLFGSAGIPDIVFVAPDVKGVWRFAFLEIKVGRDKLSPAQKAFRFVMERAGIHVVVGTVGDATDWLGY